MKQNPLLLYKIGLAVIGVFVIVLVVMVVTQANGAKQDTNSFNEATKIANTLNDYIDSNGTVPQSLSDAGVVNIPSSVTYTKVSDSSYRFCVTYNSESSNFNATATETSLLSSAVNGANGSTNLNDFSGGTAKASGILIIDPTHHKGKNCQTVSPYSLNSNGLSVNDSSSLSTSPSTASTSPLPSSLCGSSSAGLTCYSVTPGGSFKSYTILFFPGSSVQNQPGAIGTISQLSSTSAGSGNAVIQIIGSGGSASSCATQTGSSVLSSYASNGTTETACSDTVGNTYQYFGIANLNGQSYYINMVSQSPISTPTVNNIFSSIKPM